MNTEHRFFLALLTAGALLSTTAIAANPAVFQAEKDRAISNLQQRLEIFQGQLSCLQAATDHTGLKACRQTVKTKMAALETQIKAQKKIKSAPPAATSATTTPTTPTPTPATSNEPTTTTTP